MHAIETRGLRKEYGDKVAVEDLTLQVPQGEVFGFLGPNGAGKTTSVKMLLGLAAPTAGQAWLLGAPIGEPAARAFVGFLPEHFRFHEWLTAYEFLDLHGSLYNVPAAERRQRIPELLELVGLTEAKDRRLRGFSKGMLQRIGLAQALLNRPRLVFLDEPTSGLDPIGRRLVRDIIRTLRDQGTTVFLNSHLLSEVEITCDRVAFIKSGRVVHLAALHTLVQGLSAVDLRVGGVTPALVAGLERFAKPGSLRADGERIHLVVDDEELLPAISQWVMSQGARLYALAPQRPSLEDLFLQVIGTDVRE
jgi:ABC-2 type transport system ATP-binding protein